MPNHYETELSQLAATYSNAISSDVSKLKEIIAGASGSSLIGIGSGGSFTAASLLCNLHESYTGMVSRASTPLEIICNPTLASTSPAFFLSAEGKNPDIVLALQRAYRHSARSVHVMTNKEDSPLMDEVKKLQNVSFDVFNLDEKDGYLATNSLLMDSVLIARAYAELAGASESLPVSLENLSIANRSIVKWIEHSSDFIAQCVSRGALTVIYSPLLKPVAVDLESKLSEAALLHCQFTDLRSYAHGRHLWLANRPDDCAILAITDPSIGKLWTTMEELIPDSIPRLEMSLGGSEPKDLIAGLVAQMHLVSRIGERLSCDPGKPEVPKFGRDLYYTKLQGSMPDPVEEGDGPERLKYEALGARWPSDRSHGTVKRAKKDYQASIETQEFRAVVFDYDGTLSHSQRRNMPPPNDVLEHIVRLVRSGIVVGIASGRGNSMRESLRDCLPQDVLETLNLALYNGGWIGTADQVPENSSETSEFLSHVTRIIFRLKKMGVPIDSYKTRHPYQVSVRFRDGLPSEQMWFVIADALRQAGLELSRITKSKHSVDILASGVSKSRLIAHIIKKFGIDPYQVVTLGDQGAWPGNDSVLLEHRFSLSVDIPSRRLDRGWKLAPSHVRDVAATLWYLDRFRIVDGNSFKISFANKVQQELIGA